MVASRAAPALAAFLRRAARFYAVWEPLDIALDATPAWLPGATPRADLVRFGADRSGGVYALLALTATVASAPETWCFDAPVVHLDSEGGRRVLAASLVEFFDGLGRGLSLGDLARDSREPSRRALPGVLAWIASERSGTPRDGDARRLARADAQRLLETLVLTG